MSLSKEGEKSFSDSSVFAEKGFALR